MIRRFFVLAIACAACSSAAMADPTPRRDPSADAKDGPAARFEHNMIVRMHMHENFGLLRAIERLLLRSKLAEARELAHAIAVSPDEPGASAWAAQATSVRAQAAALAATTTTAQAFAAEAKLASACASCHVTSGAMPDFGAPPAAPPDAPSIDARMARHLWASDRLWEGVVGAADESWTAGLDVLAATPLPVAQLGAAREALAQKLQRLAARSRRGAEPDRAVTYGAMLAICAACHATRAP